MRNWRESRVKDEGMTTYLTQITQVRDELEDAGEKVEDEELI